LVEVAVPGTKPLLLEHLVLDFNGTLACDGELIAADVVCRDIASAPGLLLNPLRLAATLRV
jgi:hypothetical protein